MHRIFRANRSKRSLAFAFGTLAACTVRAADTPAQSWHGVSLYGTVDIGVAHQNYGAPLSQDMYTGLAYLVTKNSRKPITSIAPNGLSQSKLGLKGTLPLEHGLAAVFNLESGFNPTSGRLSDALGALVHNNGVAPAHQTTGADGSRAGQTFNGPAFVGLTSPTWGTLTLGRHNTFLTDTVTAFDPLGASYAFSVLGASGTTAGGGNTQDVRLDASAKYLYSAGPWHAGVLYQPGHTDTSPGKAWQWNLGGIDGRFSAEAIVARKDRAIQAASLTAAQWATPGVPHDSLAATISDNRSYTLTAAYQPNESWKWYGGYERITYRNPDHPMDAGFTGLGGYRISFVNNAAFPHAKVLQVSWLGANWHLTKAWTLTGAWYHYDQNSYAGNGCSNRSAGTCSGTLDAYSAVLDYRFDPRLDVYAGSMRSLVYDGLANGYIVRAVTNVMTGVRVQF